MPDFIIDTTETVHGRYHIKADSADEARAMFNDGNVGKPHLYEATDVEINEVENA